MHGHTRQLALNWQGSTPMAAQCSYEGAIAAERTAETDCRRLRSFLLERGSDGATDAEVERQFGWDANISTARRWDLIRAGHVVMPVPFSRARRVSVKTGLRVSVWIASEFGRDC